MYSQNLITTPLATESNLEKLRTDNLALLRSHGLTEYNTTEEIAFAMVISLEKLHFLTTSSPTSLTRHYLPFKISKKTGGERIISAPKPELKAAQRWILENILENIEVRFLYFPPKTLALGTGTLLGTRQPYGYTNVLGVQKTPIKKTFRFSTLSCRYL